MNTCILFVRYDYTITIGRIHLLQVMNIMYTYLGNVNGMDDST